MPTSSNTHQVTPNTSTAAWGLTNANPVTVNSTTLDDIVPLAGTALNTSCTVTFVLSSAAVTAGWSNLSCSSDTPTDSAHVTVSASTTVTGGFSVTFTNKVGTNLGISADVSKIIFSATKSATHYTSPDPHLGTRRPS